MQQAAEVYEQQDEVAAAVEYAQQRLKAWGAWLRAIPDPHLGYPRGTTFAQEPGAGAAPYDDDEAMHVERLLAKMRQMEKPVDRVVQYRVLEQEYYFHSTVRDGLTHVRDAQGKPISAQRYLNERERGVYYLAIKLAGRCAA